MAAVVLVDASDMKEYVVHLNEENAKRAATDVAYALTLLNAEKARLSSSTDENSSAALESTNDGDTAPAISEENPFRWSYVETTLLLKEYKRLLPLFKSGKVSHKKCWQIVANSLRKEGVMVTHGQCDSKFSGLKRTYRAIKKHMLDTNQPRPWRFFKDMEALSKKDLPVQPRNQILSNGIDHPDKNLVDEDMHDIEGLLEEEISAVGNGEPFRWPHEAILLLIEEAMKIRQLCESGILTQTKCWDKVAEALDRQGHTVTGRQCMSKFNALRRTYRSITEYNKEVKRGEGSNRRRMEWVYYDMVGKLLEDSWTFTLNNDSQEDMLRHEDEEMVSDSGIGIGKYQNNPTGSNPSQNPIDTDIIGLTMECVDDSDILSHEITDNLSSEKENVAASREEQPQWCDKSTRLLISEFKEKSASYGSTGTLNGTGIFSAISESLEKNGFFFSPVQIEEHWKSLEMAYRSFGTGKSNSTVRIAPYYAELRNIFSKKSTPTRASRDKGLQRSSKLSILRRGVHTAKSPTARRVSGGAMKERATSLTQNSNGNVANGENGSGTPRNIKKNSSKLKADALSLLRELKEELARQNREMERQSQQREAYCNKILQQNETMIKQRDRRNELLEELLRLRKSELQN